MAVHILPCVVVEPTGVDVSSQPTQAISIALIRMMDLSRCMWPVCSLLSGNGAREVLTQCPESASDERIGIGGQALFPQPRHEIGDVRRLCPGYSIKRCWHKEPKAPGQSSYAVSWIGRPPRPGSWNRAQLQAGVTDRRRCQWMFRSHSLAKPRKRSRLSQTPA